MSNFQQMMWGGLMGVALIGCGPKAHPLQSQIDALGAMRESSSQSVRAETLIVVGSPLQRRALDAVVDAMMDEIPDDLKVEVPMIGKLGVTPALKRPRTTLRASKYCAGCLRTDMSAKGTLRLPGQSKDLRWSADVVVTFGVSTLDLPKAQGVQFQAQVDGPKGVRLKVAGMPPLYGNVVNGAVTEVLTQEMKTGRLSKPSMLFKIPKSMGLRIGNIGVDAGASTKMSIDWLTTYAGEVTMRPDPGDGWAAALPSETALGLIHALLLQQEMVQNFAVEPISMHFADDRFALRVRVHKAAKRTKWREYEITGGLSVKHGKLAIVAPAWTYEGKEGAIFGGGFVDVEVGKLVDRGVLEPIEVDQVFDVAGAPWSLKAQTVTLQDEHMVVKGVIEIGEPAADSENTMRRPKQGDDNTMRRPRD